MERAVVIGGGIVGLASALSLQRAGMPTRLVDPGGPAVAASWGNAGHIAIEQVAPLASFDMIRSAPSRLTIAGGPLSLPLRDARHWLPFALRLLVQSAPSRYRRGADALGRLLAEAMPAWRRLSASLPGEPALLEGGHVVVWHDAVAAARGMAAWRSSDIGTARLHVATEAELRALGRLMRATPVAALVFENTGQIADHAALEAGLVEAFRQAGGEIRRDEARGIGLREGRATLSLASGETLAPSAILVAAGFRSGALLRPLGIRVPMVAERGYHVESAAHDWPAGTPPIVFEERSVIATRFSSGLRAAGFVEFAGPDSPPDPRRWQTLERHVRDLGLPVRGAVSRWSGARPTLPDYLPAIGRAAQAQNLFYAFGHQHLGLTLGPVSGELVADLIGGAPPSPLLEPFGLERFNR